MIFCFCVSQCSGKAKIKSGEVCGLVSARSKLANLRSTDLNAHWQLLIDQLGWSKRNRGHALRSVVVTLEAMRGERHLVEVKSASNSSKWTDQSHTIERGGGEPARSKPIVTFESSDTSCC